MSKQQVIKELAEWFDLNKRQAESLYLFMIHEGFIEEHEDDVEVIVWDIKELVPDWGIGEMRVRIGSGPTYETSGKDFVIAKDYKTMEKNAVNVVYDQLRTEPELFDQDWLAGHIYMTEKDRRQFSEDLGNGMVSDGLIDEDELDDYVERVYQATKDPIAFFVHQEGMHNSVAEFLNYSGYASIDYWEAARDAVNTDGPEHFLAHYDGQYHELDNGAVYWRIN
jgi:hypothetical protein